MHNVWKLILIFIYCYLTAFDFLNSNKDGFNISLWYKSAQKGDVEKSEINPRFVNLV